MHSVGGVAFLPRGVLTYAQTFLREDDAICRIASAPSMKSMDVSKSFLGSLFCIFGGGKTFR